MLTNLDVAMHVSLRAQHDAVFMSATTTLRDCRVAYKCKLLVW
jgi:hypothetical protein